MANLTNSTGRAIFKYSFVRPMCGLAVFLAGIILVGIGGSFSSYSPGVVFLALLSVVFLGGILRLYIIPVHRAEFFDNHFEISGRMPSKHATYSEILHVTKSTRFRPLDPFTQVSIRLSTEEAPVVIPGDPYSNKLKVDLYSWLIRKTVTQRDSLAN